MTHPDFCHEMLQLFVRGSHDGKADARPAKEDVALAMAWCDLKRAGKRDSEIFRAITKRRQRGELPAKKQRSSWALRRMAERHHLPDLITMDEELEQNKSKIQALIEDEDNDLNSRGATFQEALDALTQRYHAAEHPDAGGG